MLYVRRQHYANIPVCLSTVICRYFCEQLVCQHSAKIKNRAGFEYIVGLPLATNELENMYML